MSNEPSTTQEQSLVKFSESAAAMAAMREKAAGLVVKDIKDHAGLKKVRITRMEIKKTRVDLITYAAGLKVDALKYLKKINSSLNPLVAEMKALEDPLWKEEVRIAKEKAAGKEAQLQIRIDALSKVKAEFDYATVKKMSKPGFKKFLKEATAAYDLAEFNRVADEARLKELEKQQQASVPLPEMEVLIPTGGAKDVNDTVVPTISNEIPFPAQDEPVFNYTIAESLVPDDRLPLMTLLGQLDEIVIMPFNTKEGGMIGTEVIESIEKWKKDIDSLLNATK